jgi:hypothetical protein
MDTEDLSIYEGVVEFLRVNGEVVRDLPPAFQQAAREQGYKDLLAGFRGVVEAGEVDLTFLLVSVLVTVQKSSGQAREDYGMDVVRRGEQALMESQIPIHKFNREVLDA